MRVYGVQLSFNNKEEVLQFPINPASIEIVESGQGKTYDISGIGEINVIKNRNLTEYSFSGLFPAQRYPFVREEEILQATETTYKRFQYELLHPVKYINLIEKWMVTKRPIRFIFNSSSYDINTAVSIESFQWEESAGGGGDIEYTIRLKKYVFYSAKKITTNTANASGKIEKSSTDVRPTDKQQAKTYKLVAGDTLWAVAKKQLGNGSRWKELQTLNQIKDSDLKKLPVGKVLMLP